MKKIAIVRTVTDSGIFGDQIVVDQSDFVEVSDEDYEYVKKYIYRTGKGDLQVVELLNQKDTFLTVERCIELGKVYMKELEERKQRKQKSLARKEKI